MHALGESAQTIINVIKQRNSSTSNKIFSDSYPNLDKIVRMTRNFRNAYTHCRYIDEELFETVLSDLGNTQSRNATIQELQALAKILPETKLISNNISTIMNNKTNCIIC
jgi:hypothetical protein